VNSILAHELALSTIHDRQYQLLEIMVPVGPEWTPRAAA